MKLNIPTDMSEVTLKQYQDFEAYRNGKHSELDIIIRAIEIFCNIESARSIEFESIKKISTHLLSMLEQKPTLRPIWDKYGFIPNLRTISFGELIDLDTYLKDIQTYHKAVAVLFRPIEAKFRDMYSIEPYESAAKYEDEMLNMPLDVALGASLFFWTIGLELAKDILPFLEMPSIPTLTTFQPMRSFIQDGDGMNQFSNLQEATS
jgi:hypothetical protein